MEKFIKTPSIFAVFVMLLLILNFLPTNNCAQNDNGPAFVVHYSVQPLDATLPPTNTNRTLNAVDWKPKARYGLIVGDRTVLKCTDNGFIPVDLGVAFNWHAVAWRPQGDFALIVGEYGSIYRYDGSNLTNVSYVPITHDTPNTIRGAAWKPDGSYALLVGDEGHISAFDPSRTDNNQTRFTFIKDKTVYLSSVAWKPDGSYALIVGNKGTVIKFDDKNKEFTNLTSGVELLGRTDQDLLAVTWSPDGEYALILGTHETILKYDGTIFTTKYAGAGRFTTLRNIAWKPDERPDLDGYQGYALIVGDNGLVIKYNESLPVQFETLSTQIGSDLHGVSWEYNGSYAVIAGTDGLVLRYPDQRPIAEITIDDVVTNQGRIVTFYGYNSRDPDGAVRQYCFEFGDGTDSGWMANPATTHAYDTVGRYNASLRVRDDKDVYSTNVAVIPVIVGVVDSTNKPPSAKAGPDIKVMSGKSLQFYGEGIDADGRIVYYQWDFDGDGKYDWNSTTTGNAAYTYPKNGTYRAVFRVTDNNGGIAKDTVIVEAGETGGWFLPAFDILALLCIVSLILFVDAAKKKIQNRIHKILPKGSFMKRE